LPLSDFIFFCLDAKETKSQGSSNFSDKAYTQKLASQKKGRRDFDCKFWFFPTSTFLHYTMPSLHESLKRFLFAENSKMPN
jgi:hypothetical protein